jgi:tRNA-Thr(GGU) m(6)t(6)A37 methyltransferase TsaA
MSAPLQLHPIGVVRSPLRARDEAPKQGDEGAPEAWLELDPAVAEAARELRAGSEVLVFTWLDRGDRSVLAVHPRDDDAAPLTGVFSTRSQDRPNPIGLHGCRRLEVAPGPRPRVAGLEAFDGTPVLDLKPPLDARRER